MTLGIDCVRVWLSESEKDIHLFFTPNCWGRPGSHFENDWISRPVLKYSANEFDKEHAEVDLRLYLHNPLTYWDKTWYHKHGLRAPALFQYSAT